MPQVAIGEELLRMAVEIEKNGRKFYSQAADRSRVSAVKDKFDYLADQEKKHEDTFVDMLKRVGKLEPRAYAAGDIKEEYQYIKDLAASSIFTGEKAAEAFSSRSLTDAAAVEFGIGFEKDSILFYTDLRGMLPKDEQNLLDMIVHEEKKHLSELQFLKSKVTKE